jgi:hypothetical protein
MRPVLQPTTVEGTGVATSRSDHLVGADDERLRNTERAAAPPISVMNCRRFMGFLPAEIMPYHVLDGPRLITLQAGLSALAPPQTVMRIIMAL